MRRSWKKVAERADNSAFTADEISEPLRQALTQEVNGLPPTLARTLDQLLRIDELFRDQQPARIESLRPNVAGDPFGNLFLDCAVKVAINGEGGADLTLQAMSDALAVRAARGAAQVEEHYLRESSSPRAHKVRSRIEEGISKVSVSDLARQLLRPESAPQPQSRPKQDGLDDGIQI